MASKEVSVDSSLRLLASWTREHLAAVSSQFKRRDPLSARWSAALSDAYPRSVTIRRDARGKVVLKRLVPWHTMVRFAIAAFAQLPKLRHLVVK
jgi:hypothetical protein